MYCIARQCVLPPLSKEQADNLLTEAALHSLAEGSKQFPIRVGHMAYAMICLSYSPVWPQRCCATVMGARPLPNGVAIIAACCVACLVSDCF